MKCKLEVQVSKMCNTRNYYAVYEIKTAKIVDFVSLQNPVIDPA